MANRPRSCFPTLLCMGLAAWMSAVPRASHGAGQQIACPLILPEGSIAVTHPPAGWLGSSSLLRLTGGGVMRGHPQLMQYLVPAGSKKTKAGTTLTYAFDAGEEKWIWCTYGGTGAVQISKRMDDAASECALTYKETRRDGITEMYAACSTQSGRAGK
jgi:hypothetical protein